MPYPVINYISLHISVVKVDVFISLCTALNWLIFLLPRKKSLFASLDLEWNLDREMSKVALACPLLAKKGCLGLSKSNLVSYKSGGLHNSFLLLYFSNAVVHQVMSLALNYSKFVFSIIYYPLNVSSTKAVHTQQ